MIEPLFESRTDHMIMYQLAREARLRQGAGRKSIKLVPGKGGMMEPEPESMLREINRGTWTIGYTGQSPERLKAHMRNMHVFDVKTLRAQGRQGRGDRLRPDRRLLRPAVAVLRHAGDEASRARPTCTTPPST